MVSTPRVSAAAWWPEPYFGPAVLLHLATDVSLRDTYLATTPGGIYAVLAVAFGAGADTTFILGVQGLRLLVVVLLAPLAVRRVAGPGGKRGASESEPPQAG